MIFVGFSKMKFCMAPVLSGEWTLKKSGVLFQTPQQIIPELRVVVRQRVGLAGFPVQSLHALGQFRIDADGLQDLLRKLGRVGRFKGYAQTGVPGVPKIGLEAAPADGAVRLQDRAV